MKALVVVEIEMIAVVVMTVAATIVTIAVVADIVRSKIVVRKDRRSTIRLRRSLSLRNKN